MAADTAIGSASASQSHALRGCRPPRNRSRVGLSAGRAAWDPLRMAKSNEDLAHRIEQLVREHLEATRRAAAAAVERAYSSDLAAARARTRRETARSPSRASNGRRSPAELSALSERLHEAVCAQPGETMSVLAPALGKTPRELQRPMMALKREGRVRSVGQRHQTRYFPTVTRPIASAG